MSGIGGIQGRYWGVQGKRRYEVVVVNHEAENIRIGVFPTSDKARRGMTLPFPWPKYNVLTGFAVRDTVLRSYTYTTGDIQAQALPCIVRYCKLNPINKPHTDKLSTLLCQVDFTAVRSPVHSHDGVPCYPWRRVCRYLRRQRSRFPRRFKFVL